MTAIRRVQRLHGLKDSTFGRAALRDGALIRNLKNGRQLRPSTEMRLRSFIAAMEKEAGNA